MNATILDGRRTVGIVAGCNLAYFAVEFGMALAIASTALLADSVDFLEDAAVNALILVALGWTAAMRARLGMVLAGLLLMPAVAMLWTLWEKIAQPEPPAPVPLALTGLGALVVNLLCAFLLARYRTGGSLMRAAFLSARNDAAANLAIITAGLATAVYPSIWPDIVVGFGIAAMNVGAAKEVMQAARAERRDAAS